MNQDIPIRDSVELAQLPEFIKWVKDGAVKPEWMSTLSKEKMGIVDEACTLVDVVSHENEKEMDIILRKNIWKRINSTIEDMEGRQKKGKTVFWISATIAFAASFALVVFFMPDKTSNNVSYYASSAAQEITLPAQSEIRISKGSTLTYDQSQWADERKVSLEGEAFFDVTKGVPFIVSTSSGQVTVLGTSFEVSQKTAELAVTVVSGSVQVKTGPYQEVLKRDDQYFLNLTQAQLSGVNISSGMKYYKFVEHPIGDVITLVESLYGVDISFPTSENGLRYTGYFQSSFNVEEVMTRITEPYRLQYNINGSSIVVSK